MTSNSEKQKTQSIPATSIADICAKFFYSQPIYIQDLPTQRLFVTIKNEQEVEISDRDKAKKNKEITFQAEADFFPFFLRIKQQTFIVIGSTFSLYDYVSREPYLEAKAEYQFQQQLRKALKLTGGYVYHLPGDSSDFVATSVDLEDVVSQNLELRYEHDDQYFYLFVLI